MEQRNGGGLAVMKSLSARLLLLTIVFVMIAELLIYVPSIARFRITYLEQRAEEAHLAALSLMASPNFRISEQLERELLEAVDARAIVLDRPETRILIFADAMPPAIDASFDLADRNPLILVRDAFATLFAGPGRLIRVTGGRVMEPATRIELIIPEAPLRAAMLTYSRNILALSIIISLITAGLLFLVLQWLMVRPMRRITESMIAFRGAPEDPATDVTPSRRRDEIGVAERELAVMQDELRQALRQKTRLAELGAAVSKINHDLRNILASAQLISDRLQASEDPAVRNITPRLIEAIDRAIALCTRTLKHGSAEEPPPDKSWFALFDIVEEVAATVGLPEDGRIVWQNDVAADVEVHADRDQFFRILLNLGRNAIQAVGEQGEIRINGHETADGVVIEVSDTGPGLPKKAREQLFKAFVGSARAGGTGLGLAIVNDLMIAHGGQIALEKSDERGTTFRLFLPGRGKPRRSAVQ